MVNSHRNRQLVREFVRSIDPNFMVQFGEDEFYVVIDQNIINATFNSDPLGDKLYAEFVEENFDVSIDPFLSGLLHECGHIFTYSEERDHERDVLYYMLQCNFDIARFKEYTMMYFAIPSEYNATAWGVNYYLTNKEYCDNFIKEINNEA